MYVAPTQTKPRVLLVVICLNKRACFLILSLTAVKYFTSVLPHCPDSLVNLAPYSHPEPVIFHSPFTFVNRSLKRSLRREYAHTCTHACTHTHSSMQCASITRRSCFRLLHKSCSVKSCHWNIVLLLVLWQRAGRPASLSQCVSSGAMGWWGSPSVSALQSQCAEIMPIRLGQSRPSLREIWLFHSFHTMIHTLHRDPSLLWKMSASMNAFIYDPFFKLMPSHAANLDAEKALHAELCLHMKHQRLFINEWS